jgi:hypothetical protein
MARIFFVKIKLYNSDKNVGDTQIVLKTFGFDENDAEENVSRLVETWHDVEEYAIETISSFPITIEKFVVIATLKYKNGKTKTIKYNTRAENAEDAESFFREAVATWNHVVNIQIHSIEKRI